MNEEELKKRTKQFALRVMKLVGVLPKTIEGRAIGNQLIRSGTSIGANYRAACKGRSKKEFIAKLGIVEEEADEHQFFYTVEGDAASRMTVEITDVDINDLPVGLEFTVSISSGGAAAGVLNVVLFHYDDVEKDGTSQSAESDIDIDIPVTIQ